MALSYSLSGGANTNVDAIAVAANAPGAGDVELRISTTANLTRKEVEKIVHTFMRRLKDGRDGADFNAI